MKIDLHTHTTASDGKLSPQQLINKAVEENIDVIAITDHDTVNGLINLEEGEAEALKIIPGIEISTRQKCSIHILGYFIDIHNKELLRKIEKIEVYRMREIKQVVKNLADNIDSSISVRDIIKEENVLTMNGVADYLCKKGFSKSRQDSYDEYLQEGKCGFVQKKCMEPKKAIEVITVAGGISVLAHPNRLKMSRNEIQELISELVGYGLKGIEVYCKEMDEVEWYTDICHKYNLIITGGSDFHKEEDKLGYWDENKLIPSDTYKMLCN